MTSSRTVFGLGALLVSLGCSKESMLRSALEDPEERRETLALTLEVFDEHPEYVDELFAMAREHPPTFERLLDQTARALSEPEFAAEVAGHLAAHPEAVKQITLAMLAEAKNHVEVRRAIAEALLGSEDATAQILREHPAIVQRAILQVVTP